MAETVTKSIDVTGTLVTGKKLGVYAQTFYYSCTVEQPSLEGIVA
jgi:hypothetical protein